MEKAIGKFTVKTELGDCCESPREWAFGKMCLKHRRYDLPHEIELDKARKARVVLPVYMLDHGRQAFSTVDFKDPWDSGMVGFIVAFAEDIRRSYCVKRITKRIVDEVIDTLKHEVEEYETWFNGEIYQFSVTDDEGNEVDFSDGFYDEEAAYENGVEAAEALMRELA